MARKRSLWTEWQREAARRQRMAQQQRLAAEREVKRQIQGEQQAARAAARQATLSEKERKRLYLEDQKTEVASMVSELRVRMEELDLVLVAGIRPYPAVTFTSLKRSPAFPAFNAGGLERAIPQPRWEQFAPLLQAGWPGCSVAAEGMNDRRLAPVRRTSRPVHSMPPPTPTGGDC